MEEEKRNIGTDIEENNKETIERPEEGINLSNKEISLIKAGIAIFMLGAALCTLMGFYAGINYSSEQCNEHYEEFFDTHCCMEGSCKTQSVAELSYINLGDIDDS